MRKSAWNKGVEMYAEELRENYEMMVEYHGGYRTTDKTEAKAWLLNGARNWKQYSEDGCSLVWNVAIAKRLCNPTELKRTKNGEKRPNAFETWLDVQARALYQACELVLSEL